MDAYLLEVGVDFGKVNCHQLSLLLLIPYNANNMDPDQTAPFGAVWSGIRVHSVCDRDVWRTSVRSAMRAASQLPGKEPTDVDDAPASAR